MSNLASLLPSRHVVFPCDMIDLREILRDKVINFPSYIPLFSQKFADKFLKRYPLFLIIDITKVEEKCYKYGGLCLVLDNELDIEKAIVRIIINSPSCKKMPEKVNGVLKDLDMDLECYQSNSVPGISPPNPVLAKINSMVFKTSQKVIGVSSELPLDPKEEDIFNFLRQVKKDYNLPVQMRVAGGWVRDKLLGKESDDIDIAVDMPGYDLAKIIAEAAVKYNVTHDPKAYKVSLEKSADPNEVKPSDSLMVGAVYLFGQKIEFVPMRTEFYPEADSRQPSIQLTNDPQKDVKRRDLTINALYYNVDTGQVEDYVGGKNDLGLDGSDVIKLRTPDEPFKTFHEDPLRLLRVLRFHSRYPNSEIDPSIIEAMEESSIQESYAKKVATERAGPELMKMLMGENPVDSLKLLFETGLYSTVFKIPDIANTHSDGISMDQQTPWHVYNLMEHTLQVVQNMNNIMKQNGEDDRMRGLMNLAAVFHDFGKMEEGMGKPHPKGNTLPDGRPQMQYIGHEKSSKRMADKIMKSIGIGKDERDIVNQVIRLHMRPHDADKWGPKGKGKFLRETRMHGKEEEHKDLWKYVFYHAEADDMASDPDKYDKGQRRQMFEDYSNFVNSPVGQFKGTVVNGNDVMTIFPDLKPSTGYIKEVLDYVKELQDNGQINVNQDLGVAKQQAINFIEQIAPQIISKYGESTMGNNWYSKIKKAQTLLIPSQCDSEIKKGPKLMGHNFQQGMKVRDRRKGMVNPQDYGIVEEVKGNIIVIKWNPGSERERKEKFDSVRDSVALSLIVAGV